MPVNKSKGQRKGIQNGVQRHKLRSRPLVPHDADYDLTKHTAWSLREVIRRPADLKRLATHRAEQYFNLTSSICCILCFTPYLKDDNGRFGVATSWRRAIHRVIIGVLCITCIHKLVVTMILFVMQKETTTVLVLSYVGFHLQFTAMCSGLGFIFMPSLSCESINSWNVMLSEVASRLGQIPRSPWSCLSASLQVLFTTAGLGVALFVFPLFSFIFPTMPIFTFQSLKMSGLFEFPDDWVFNTAMRVICYLIDVSIYGASIFLMAFASQFIVTEIANLKTLFSDLRGLRVATLEQRKELEYLYITLYLHTKALHYYHMLIHFSNLTNLSAAAILCMYIPIRHHEVPAFLRLCFFLVGVIVLIICFWWSYDVVLLIRASEEVLEKLRSFDHNWRENGISDIQRLRYLKRAKACRPVGIPIGAFGEFSLDVPVIMWDEILNQLLFLLSF